MKGLKWDATQGWQISNPVIAGSDSVSISGLTSFSNFTAADMVATPIDFLSFNAHVQDEDSFFPQVMLDWNTATETNNKEFLIERCADKVFKTIGSVQGWSNSLVQKNYFFIDKNPLPGRSFYRLKQVDNDENYTYSRTIEVLIPLRETMITDFMIANPVNSELSFSLVSGHETGNILVTVTDLSGREIIEKNEILHAGINKYALDISGIGAGVYFLKILQNNIVASIHKFVKY